MADSETTPSNGLDLDLDESGPTQKKSILIIDDEPGIRESLELIFAEDFAVYQAMDGRQGLDLFNSLPIDLVLLDLRLPEIDGIEVLKRITESSRKVPVMVITGYSTHEWAMKCADLEVSGYVQKPFDANDLLKRVRKRLGNHAKRASGNRLSRMVKESISFIQGRYTEPIRPKDVASHVGVSRKHLGERFKKKTGYSMDEYTERLRTKKSKQLLVEARDAKLLQIARQSGFHDVSHFERIFKKYTGMTPAAFRKISLDET